MLIIRPYGRSFSEFDQKGKNRRSIQPNTSPFKPLEIREFAKTHPKLIITQWVSIIDKIATKPFDLGKPTREQWEFRNGIGRACLALINEKDLLPDPHGRRKRLERFWWTKIHPYGSEFDDKTPRNPRGRWYARFSQSDEVSDNNPRQIAENIYEHLYEAEYRIKSDRPLKLKGQIFARAISITDNVLNVPAVPIAFDFPWSEEDKAAYAEKGNIAEQVSRALLELAGSRVSQIRHRVAAILYHHFSQLFIDTNGIVQSISEAKSTYPALFALHTGVKEVYGNLLKTQPNVNQKKLPKTTADLFHFVEKRQRNRDLNSLIRLGKAIHYEATPAFETDGPQNIIDCWPDDLALSRYWTSEGQSEIKHNEAFVRIWRNTIAFAARNVKDWADPDDHIGRDILGANEIKMALENFNESHFDQKLAVLFGNRRNFLSGSSVEVKKSILHVALAGIRDLRHNSFHFKGQSGFIHAINNVTAMVPGTFELLLNLWNADEREKESSLHRAMHSAHFNSFFCEEHCRAIASAILAGEKAHLPLPRFRRVLLRANNAWHLSGFRSELPALANKIELEAPEKICRYTALKLLYEQAFPAWLQKQSKEEINTIVDKAHARTTKEARKILNDDRVIARGTGSFRLQDDETIATFWERLSGAAATESRMQNNLAFNSAKEKKQGDYLKNLWCDVILQSFEKYLKEADFHWLLKSLESRNDNEPTRLELSSLFPPAADTRPRDWQVVLYFLLHLVPVDEISKLRHQLSKWRDLDGDFSAVAKTVDQVFDLYIDQHDEKFVGGFTLSDVREMRSLYESDDLPDRIFHDPSQSDKDKFVLSRGAREMLRFGNLTRLMPVFQQHIVTEEEISAFHTARMKTSGSSSISIAQATRQKLHDEWVRGGRKLSPESQKEYVSALTEIVGHRNMATHVALRDHVLLHRLLMLVLARLLDYSGLWERDLYFASLAVIHLHGERPEQVFTNVRGRSPILHGQIVRALGHMNETPAADALIATLKLYFGVDLAADGPDPKIEIRNDLAHFNVLRRAGSSINLTNVINKTRTLMSYDQKLKNSVSKSIIQLLERQGLGLTWQMKDHLLRNATVTSLSITHLGDANIREDLHGDRFVDMVQILFGES